MTRSRRDAARPADSQTPALLMAMEPFDAAHFRLDQNFIRSVLTLDRRPDYDAFADGLDRLAARLPKLRMVAERRPKPHWREVDGFRGRDNLLALHLPHARRQDDYFSALAGLDLAALLVGRPAWLWIIAEGAVEADPPAVLMFCWHHAMADGRFGMMVAQELDDSRPITRAADDAEPARPVGPTARMLAGLAWASGALTSLITVGRMPEWSPPRPAFDSAQAARRGLKRVAARLGTDLETTIYAMALAAFRLAGSHGHQSGARRNWSGMLVPLSLHRAVPRGRFTNAFVPARVSGAGTLDPADAGLIVRSLRAQRRRLMGPFALRVFRAYLDLDMRLGRFVPDAAYSRIRRGWLRGLAGACTIIPGPSRLLVIAGARVRAIIGFAPLLEGSPLSIAIITYAGRVAFGFTRDAARLADGEAILRIFADALGEGVETTTSTARVEPVHGA